MYDKNTKLLDLPTYGDGTTPRAGLSILHKIKMEHVQLTSYSKMRVDLAAQVSQ